VGGGRRWLSKCASIFSLMPDHPFAKAPNATMYEVDQEATRTTPSTTGNAEGDILCM